MHALALAFLIALSPPAQAKEHDPLVLARDFALPGIYLTEGWEGTNPYTGMCAIKHIHKDAYHFVNVSGKVVVEGIGIRTGDTFAVSWSNGKVHGVSSFLIQNGSLDGRWTWMGEIHREKMTLLSRFPYIEAPAEAEPD